MCANNKNIAIIGGGITGLAAAFYLNKNENETYDFTLFERSERLGGKIQTVKRDGFIIERGPDSLVARKPSGVKLIKDVGLESELVGNAAGQAYVLNNDKLYPIPGGAIMGIPTEVGPFIETELFSLKGKARAACDLILPRQSRENEDQSLGYFFRKRLGNEVVENLIEPLLSGIYSGDIDELSLMATFPQFYEVEQKHRSLILGMKKTKPKRSKKQAERKPSAFVTLRNGLESLVTKIEQLLPAESIRKNTTVEKVVKKSNGYELQLNSGEKLHFDAVIITSPHSAVRHMLRDYSFVNILENYPLASVANVAMAFDASSVRIGKDGTGFVVSRNANYNITACTWTDRKWPHTTPDGKVLFRGYVGRPGHTEIVDADDEEMIDAVLQDLKKMMHIKGKPNFYVITRWKNMMPQYTVGHKLRIDALKSNVQAELPGVFLAGSSFEGVGIPDCINQGIAAVEQTRSFLNKKA
ncbi:protoporphyrinogen oxidase [Pueribacillus sp. YX66]|uniref:protoporphyrinogen oxidase n=1 Tax=Pueribacillus sp. YX66 TaxID=3229242 RepID=UPI00358D5B89